MEVSRETLIRWFGKTGIFFHDIARGYDPRPVISERERKSIGKETTLDEDTDDTVFMTDVITQLSHNVSRMMKEENLTGRTITLKLKYHDFQSVTRSITIKEPVNDAETIVNQALLLLGNTEAGMKKVRLLGVSISHFPGNDNRRARFIQLLLPFD